MNKRKLGPFEVGAIGYGGLALTGLYGPYELQEATTALDAALECGVTLFDTCNFYHGASSERSLASYFKSRRNDLVLSTKFGMVTEPNVPYTRLKTQTGASLRVNGKPEYAEQCLHQSLKNLATDRLDLWLLNYPDPSVPIEETVGAMGKFVKAGKVRAIGVCNVTPEQVKLAHRAHPLTAVQNEFSPWKPQDAERLFPFLQANNIAYIAWSPLAAGLFAGVRRVESKDFRQQLPRFAGEMFAKNLRTYAEFPMLAEAAGCTRAQLALGWELLQAKFVIPIPSTRRVTRVRQNCVASNLAISGDILQRLNLLIRKAKPFGPSMFE